jgi:hypothetical protein
MNVYTFECWRKDERRISIKAETEEEAEKLLATELRRVYERERINYDNTLLSSIHSADSYVPTLQKKDGQLSVDFYGLEHTPAPQHIQNILRESDLTLEEDDENL